MTGASGTLLDHHAQRLIAGIDNLQTVIDIGPGAGKYGRMVRDAHPDAHITGLEIDADYPDRFKLSRIYDQVLVQRGSEIMRWPNVGGAVWDLVIAGDVLEHMPKSEGLDLLHFLVYRAHYLWLVWPMRYIQGDLDGHVSEAHVSVWTESDVCGLNADYVRFYSTPLEGYAINGYPNNGRPVSEIMGGNDAG